MKVKELEIEGVKEIILPSFDDDRGSFFRTFDENIFREFGIPYQWVQENYSINKKKNIIRGLHFILPPNTDGKLIRCTRGKIWDLVVDLRAKSPTLGKYLVNELSEHDYKWLYIPKGFAHGFCTLTDHSAMIYKHDTLYHKASDCGILWNDQTLQIPWPVTNPIVSGKDQSLQTFNEFINKFGGLKL
jgi:dTDP-4-dehydrorhamnose 3,5-epimerase